MLCIMLIKNQRYPQSIPDDDSAGKSVRVVRGILAMYSTGIPVVLTGNLLLVLHQILGTEIHADVYYVYRQSTPFYLSSCFSMRTVGV